MEKINNFMGLYGSFFKRFEGLSNNERWSLLKEMTSRVVDLYPNYFKKLVNNNETTEEKMENRVNVNVGNKQSPGYIDVMPKSPETIPSYIQNGESKIA